MKGPSGKKSDKTKETDPIRNLLLQQGTVAPRSYSSPETPRSYLFQNDFAASCLSMTVAGFVWR